MTKKVRSLKALKKDLWDLFSKDIRRLYADKNGFCECYTCGVRKYWKELQAGHGIAGRGNAILFDKRIVRPQCYSCNIGKHGNYQVFIPKLIKEISQELYEKIEIGSHKVLKVNRIWYEGEIKRLKESI